MNAKLIQDLKNDSGLFEYSILISDVEYEADIQVGILNIIWNYLKRKGYLNDDIFYLEDRHIQDDLVSQKSTVNNAQVENLLTNEKAIFRVKDFYVYDLLYSESEKFMLRWWNQDEGDDEIYCDFTLILEDVNELGEVRKMIKENVVSNDLELIIMDAKKYFDKREVTMK